MDGGGMDVRVTLNTGGFAIGSASGYFVPIWRVDNGRTWCSNSLCVFFCAS